jgi:hypothetical protein
VSIFVCASNKLSLSVVVVTSAFNESRTLFTVKARANYCVGDTRQLCGFLSNDGVPSYVYYKVMELFGWTPTPA